MLQVQDAVEIDQVHCARHEVLAAHGQELLT